MKKNEIRDLLTRQLNFEGDLETTIKILQKTIKGYKKISYIRFEVDKETEYGYGRDEQYDEHHLYGIRLETDEELAKRIADSKKRSAAAKKSAKTKAIKKAERERKQYIKLKAKFEG